MRRIVLSLFATSLISACAPKPNDCAFLDGGYPLLRTNLAALPNVTGTAVPRESRRIVERCYVKRPYWDYRGQFRFLGAKRTARGNFYLIYQPQLITDVLLLFETGPDGRPVRAFTYSTL
jgi:hypothetical protein